MFFKSGVSWYTRVTMRFDYFFPEGLADCRHCDFCTYSENFQTYRCRLTNEFVDKSQLNSRGQMCPAVFDDTPF